MWLKLEQISPGSGSGSGSTTHHLNSFDSPSSSSSSSSFTSRSQSTLNSISLNHDQHSHQSSINHHPQTTINKTQRHSISKSKSYHHHHHHHHDLENFDNQEFNHSIKSLNSNFNQTQPPNKPIKSKSYHHHQENIDFAVKSNHITIPHSNSSSTSNHSNHHHQHHYPMTLQISPPTRPPKSIHRQSQSHYHTISSSSSLKVNSIHHSHQSPASLKELIINHQSSNLDHRHQHRQFLTLNSILSSSSVTPQSHYRTQSSQITNQSPNPHSHSHLQSNHQVHHQTSTSFLIDPTNAKPHVIDEFLSTDEFASAEEGDESIWIAGEQDELEVSSSYTSSSASSNQSKPISKSSKSPFLSIRETLIRPTLPLHWTSTPNINSINPSKPIPARKSKSVLPSPVPRHSDQIPRPSYHLQESEPIQTPSEDLRPPSQLKKASSKEDLPSQTRRSSKLISHPVAKSLSRAFGSDFFHLNHHHKADQSHQSNDTKKSKPPRPRLPSSNSSYLSFKSFQNHHSSPQSPNEDNHHHHPNPKSQRLSSLEMSKPLISLPFLTASASNLPLSHPRSHSSPGTILTDQPPPQEEHNLGLGGRRRTRQLTSDDKPSSRNSSTLYLKQLSHLFHPHSSHTNLAHHSRERLVSTISSQSIMTVQPTWKEEVAKEDYTSFLSMYGMMEMKRQEVIHELIETEKKYILQLRNLMKLFYKSEEIEHESIFKVLPKEIGMIFEELKKILKIHSEEIWKRVIDKDERKGKKVKENVGKDWLRVIRRFKVYETFLIKFELSMKSIEDLKRFDADHRYWIGMKRIESLEHDDLRFGKGEVFNGLSLTSFLLKPVQRLMKYPLFFKQLKDLTPPTHSDYQAINLLSEKIDEIIKEMQQKKIRYESILKKKVLGKFEFQIDCRFHSKEEEEEEEEEEGLSKSRSRGHRRRRRDSLVSEFGSEDEDDEKEEGEDGEKFRDVEVIVFENEILMGIDVFKIISFDERLVSSGVIQVWMMSSFEKDVGEGEVGSIWFYVDQNESKERKKLKEFMKLLLKIMV